MYVLWTLVVERCSDSVRYFLRFDSSKFGRKAQGSKLGCAEVSHMFGRTSFEVRTFGDVRNFDVRFLGNETKFGRFEVRSKFGIFQFVPPLVDPASYPTTTKLDLLECKMPFVFSQKRLQNFIQVNNYKIVLCQRYKTSLTLYVPIFIGPDDQRVQG